MRHRYTALFLLVLLLLAGTSVLWLRGEQRQYALNRQLIFSLVHSDDKQALTLVNAGADPNTRYAPTPVPSLLQLVKQVFHRSPPPINDSPTALAIACGAPWQYDNTTNKVQTPRPDAPQLVRAMFTRGANVGAKDANEWTPLWWAIYGERWNTVGLLLEHGADVNAKNPNQNGETPLIAAVALHASPNVVRVLLEHGADANAKDKNGVTPLIDAAEGCYSTDVVRLLLEHGADANAQDINGMTPLMLTEEEDTRPEAVRLLLDHRANVNMKDRNGWTPLMFAATNDVAQILVPLLLRYNVEVNVKNRNGETALYVAMRGIAVPTKTNAIKDVMRQLLAHGADPNVQDIVGDTPLKLAQQSHHSDIVALLRHYGARK